MEGDEVFTTRRTPADFRIQKRGDFALIADENRYWDGGAQESSNYRYLTHKKVFYKGRYKKVGKARDLFAEELTSENKGYPKGFKDYHTYDQKYNENYKRRQLRKGRK